LTTVEGFACGVPGIVYNSTASPELISSETGKIVEVGDIEKLSHAIIDICESQINSEQCRKRAVNLYNKNERYLEYVDLYEKLIGIKSESYNNQ